MIRVVSGAMFIPLSNQHDHGHVDPAQSNKSSATLPANTSIDRRVGRSAITHDSLERLILTLHNVEHEVHLVCT